jgi:hypothetical protein
MGGESDVFFQTFTCDASTLFYTRGGLSPYAGMPFKFQLIAVNYQGNSLPSSSVRILAAVVPDAPAAPLQVSASKTQITIRWNPPA